MHWIDFFPMANEIKKNLLKRMSEQKIDDRWGKKTNSKTPLNMSFKQADAYGIWLYNV